MCIIAKLCFRHPKDIITRMYWEYNNNLSKILPVTFVDLEKVPEIKNKLPQKDILAHLQFFELPHKNQIKNRSVSVECRIISLILSMKQI